MSEPDQLLQILRSNPSEREPHLVMADWLSQRGDPRGELALLHDRIIEGDRDLLPLCARIIEAHLSEWLGFEAAVDEVTLRDRDLRIRAGDTALTMRWGFIVGFDAPSIERLAEVWDRPAALLSCFSTGGLEEGELAGLLSARDPSPIREAALHRSLLGARDVEALARMTGLRALSITDSPSLPGLSSILEQLVYLCLDHCTQLDDAALAPPASLRHLSLFGCTRITGAVLDGLHRLTTLSLGRIDLDDDRFEALLQLRDLRRLDLSESSLSNPRLRALVDAMPKLEVVSLRRSRGITPDGFLALLELAHLARVDVAGTAFRHTERFERRWREGVVSFDPKREAFRPPSDIDE